MCLVHAQNRGEEKRSILAMNRSFVVRPTNDLAAKEATNRYLHSNQWADGGLKGEREMKKKSTEKDARSRHKGKGRHLSQAAMKIQNDIEVLSCCTNGFFRGLRIVKHKMNTWFHFWSCVCMKMRRQPERTEGNKSSWHLRCR